MKTKYYMTTCCLMGILALAAPSFAEDASDSSSATRYSDMTMSDCTSLPSKQGSYSSSEYRSRSEYCRGVQNRSGSESASSLSSNSNSGINRSSSMSSAQSGSSQPSAQPGASISSNDSLNQGGANSGSMGRADISRNSRTTGGSAMGGGRY